MGDVTPSNDVLSSRLDSLSGKVDDLARDIREDIGHLTNAIQTLSFVDQRVHDIEIASIKEMASMNHLAAMQRIDGLTAEVEAEKERRSFNFRMAVGAVLTALFFPMVVGLVVYEITKG
jgi:hypothetical protein